MRIKLALISTLGILAGKVVPTGAFTDRQITGRYLAMGLARFSRFSMSNRQFREKAIGNTLREIGTLCAIQRAMLASAGPTDLPIRERDRPKTRCEMVRRERARGGIAQSRAFAGLCALVTAKLALGRPFLRL